MHNLYVILQCVKQFSFWNRITWLKPHLVPKKIWPFQLCYVPSTYVQLNTQIHVLGTEIIDAFCADVARNYFEHVCNTIIKVRYEEKKQFAGEANEEIIMNT